MKTIATIELPAPSVPTFVVHITETDAGDYTVEWDQDDVRVDQRVYDTLDGATKNLVYPDLGMAVAAVALLARCASKDYHASLAECWDINMDLAIGESLEYHEW